MVPVTALWLPIVVSAVLVFIASSIIHMVLQLHRNDWKEVPDEDGMMDALRAHNLAPGDYCVPRVNSPSAMKDPAFVAKFKRGPVVFMTVLPGGDMAMGAQLAQWFVFSLVVSLFAVRRRRRAPGGRGLSRGLPLRRHDRVHRLHDGVLPAVHLVQEAMEPSAEEHGRRSNLRAADRRGVRLAVAVTDRRVPATRFP
jgi:hypothetical protein